MKDRLILTNNEEIGIEPGSGLTDIRVVSENGEEMLSRWKKFTDGNLKQAVIRDADGNMLASYSDLTLESETSVLRKDGTILTSFHLREKTEVELLREEVNSLKESREMLAGAVGDLGAATSALAEAQERGQE